MAHITQCPDCGSAQFIVVETYVFSASVRDGVLRYKSGSEDGGRDRIACASCEHEFSEDDFASVEYL